MNRTVKTIFFSPTGTTKKTVTVIASSIGEIDEVIDITQDCQEPVGLVQFNADDTVVFGAPVYGGRGQPYAVQALSKMKGNGAFLVAVVVYGNRAYEDALVEVLDAAKKAGFLPVAAAAFIGEHSYSSEAVPIAHGRPDQSDLEKAGEFGRVVKQKIEKGSGFEIVQSVEGNRPYRNVSLWSGLSPWTDENECIRCGICVRVCPNNAITLTEKIGTDNSLCIMCCACVKSCPVNARKLTERVLSFGQKLSIEQVARKEPVWFV